MFDRSWWLPAKYACNILTYFKISPFLVHQFVRSWAAGWSIISNSSYEYYSSDIFLIFFSRVRDFDFDVLTTTVHPNIGLVINYLWLDTDDTTISYIGDYFNTKWTISSSLSHAFSWRFDTILLEYQNKWWHVLFVMKKKNLCPVYV